MFPLSLCRIALQLFFFNFRAFFVDVLASILSSSKFSPWELSESVLPTVAEETRASSENPVTVALERAHAAAFRKGLGASLFAPAHPSVSVEDVKAFASQAFSASNIAVVGTGISQDVLSNLVEKSLHLSSTGTAASSPASKYYGGEGRQTLSNGPQTVFVGFGATGAPTAELAVLSAHLSTAPSIKWSSSLSPIASVIPTGTTVTPVLLPYSDASLFGLLVQGSSGASVKDAAVASVKVLKEKAQELKADELKAAVAKAKFAAASALESRDGFVSYVGSKVRFFLLFFKHFWPFSFSSHLKLMIDGSAFSLSFWQVPPPPRRVLAHSTPSRLLTWLRYASLFTFPLINTIKPIYPFFQTASALISSKPTFVAVGETNSLPYVDELGL